MTPNSTGEADSPEAPGTATVPRGQYRVQLDAYAGPLDLLLYLVKRHEIDLNDIPMAELVEQYLAHLKVIETIDVDKAGEFLVMAASLVEIKSQLLMPRPEAAEGEDGDAEHPDADPAIDPRFELVQQLLAYKRFKDLANRLEDRAEDWEARFPVSARTGEAVEEPVNASDADDDLETALPIDLDLEDVNILDLCAAFGRVMDSIGQLGDHAVTYDDTPISLHADDIADRLARDGGATRSMTLRQVFTGRSRGEAIGLFLATLELVRQRKVRVVQDADLQDIRLELRPESEWDDTTENDTETDWRNPETGEIEYAWPSEEAKRHAERRAKFRRRFGDSSEEQPEPVVVSADDGEASVISLDEGEIDHEPAGFTDELEPDDGLEPDR